MPKCPNCKELINSLNYIGMAIANVVLDEEGPFLASYEDVELLSSDGEYECPICNEIIFNDDDEAILFLQSDAVKEIVKELK
jgi:hypothetical protein